MNPSLAHAILTAPGYLGCCLAAAFLVNIFEDDETHGGDSPAVPAPAEAAPPWRLRRRPLAKPRTLRSVKRRQVRRAA